MSSSMSASSTSAAPRGFFSRLFGTVSHAQRRAYGQAAWSTQVTSLNATTSSGVVGPFVGIWPSGKTSKPVFEPMHYASDGHLLLVAPSRSGKARDILVRSLLTNKDSAFVIDIKGELAVITARARREIGHEVYCLNPSRSTASRLGICRGIASIR
jgi:type IV secretory pathway TraG/TraD family ATPase VirD4